LELYVKKRRWKILLLFAALLIGATSLYYTNWLVGKIAIEERKSVALWAEATSRLARPENDTAGDMDFLLQIIENNTNIPIILTDSLQNIINYSNIKFQEKRREQVLHAELQKMISEHTPILIAVSNTETQYLYYRDSRILQNLKYFPLAQFGVISLFIIVSYLAFSSSRKAEQNQVWVGMSKETAHQLGTPISSLMAWVELLKMQEIQPELIREFEKDIARLEKITERFSKIGSAPELVLKDLKATILTTTSYLENRSSKRIKFLTELNPQPCLIAHNPALFSWVIENICKNAIDAIEGEGTIILALQECEHVITLDITDSGKGIPKSNHKTIFEPGYTTKKRGWGLGLSLAKRIVENYHRGKIFIKHSEPGKGTTFRITLRKE